MPVKDWYTNEDGVGVSGFGRQRQVEEINTYLIPKRYVDQMVDMSGHFILNRNIEYVEAGYITRGQWQSGKYQPTRVFTSVRTKVGETAQIQLPQSVRSPLDEVAEYGNDCYFLLEIRKCAVLTESSADACLAFDDEYHLYDVIISPPSPITRRAGIRTAGENTDFRLADMVVKGVVSVMNLRNESIVTDADNPLLFTRFSEHGENCNCGGMDCCPPLSGFVGGGGTSAYLEKTEDGWETSEVIATGVTDGNYIADAIELQDGTVIVGYADDPDYFIATAGGLKIDIGGAGTFVDGTLVGGGAINEPFYGFVVSGGKLYAYGDAGTSVYSWVENTSEFINLASDAPNGAIYDASQYRNYAYFVGGLAGTYVFFRVDERDNFEDLSANLPTPSGTDILRSINVWDTGIIILGTREGKIFTSTDGGDSWSTLRTFSGTPVISSIVGNQHHILWAVDDVLYTLSPFTGLNVRVHPLVKTITGDITDISVKQRKLANDGTLRTLTEAMVVTSGGDRLLLKAFTPNLCNVLS